MRTAVLTFALAALALATVSAQRDDAKTILQEALFAEEAEQELDKAAAGYEKLIKQYDSQRNYALAALYRLAEVRRKQKRNDDAAKLYQRILEEFPDSDPQARLSTENLAAMGIVAAASPELKIPDDPDETKELRRLMMLAENKPDQVWSDYPLENASEKGWLRVVTWLFKNAEKTDHTIKPEKIPLGESAAAGHLALSQFLLSKGAKIDKLNGALVRAIDAGHHKVAEWLVENGADINELGVIVIEQTNRYIDREKNRKIVGTSPNGVPFTRPYTTSYSVSPLTAAIVRNDKVWVDRLLELKADVNLPGMTTALIITISFPETGKWFDLVVPEATDEKAAPPEFAQALIDWEDRRTRRTGVPGPQQEMLLPNPRPTHEWNGFLWEFPVLRRFDETGKLTAEKIDVLAESGYPKLEWGDIIEILSYPSRHERYDAQPWPLERFFKPKVPTLRDQVTVSSNINPVVFYTLLGTRPPDRISVESPGAAPVKLEANGGLFVMTPFGPRSNHDPNTTLQPFVQREDGTWLGCKIRTAAGDELPLSYGRIRDGDTVVIENVIRGGKQSRIRLVEAKSKFPIYQVPVDEEPIPAMVDTAGSPAKNLRNSPTLFQFIAEAYRAIDLRSAYNDSSGILPARPGKVIWESFLHENPQPGKHSDEEQLKALAAVVRGTSWQQTLLPHPDFTVVTIRRDQGEDLEIPLGRFIEACTADTPAADCRAKDIELQVGDIVEINVHHDRINQAWGGFDEDTARFFEKALSYEISILANGKKALKTTVNWKAPTYYSTSPHASCTC